MQLKFVGSLPLSKDSHSNQLSQVEKDSDVLPTEPPTASIPEHPPTPQPMPGFSNCLSPVIITVLFISSRTVHLCVNDVCNKSLLHTLRLRMLMGTYFSEISEEPQIC